MDNADSMWIVPQILLCHDTSSYCFKVQPRNCVALQQESMINTLIHIATLKYIMCTKYEKKMSFTERTYCMTKLSKGEMATVSSDNEFESLIPCRKREQLEQSFLSSNCSIALEHSSCMIQQLTLHIFYSSWIGTHGYTTGKGLDDVPIPLP